MTDTYPELSREPEILADDMLLLEYIKLRDEGNPHGFAAMLVLQSPPACRTDNTFFENRGTLSDQLGYQAGEYAAIAEQHGYRPNVRDVYEPGLAEFQGDPKAFIPATGGRGHIKKVLEERGYRVRRGDGVSNGMSVERIETQPAKTIPLAEDLIAKNTKEMLASQPHMRKLKKQEIREAVIEKHGKPSRQLKT